MSYIVACALVFGAAEGYHGITEHHWHLRFWKYANPGLAVPPPRHDTRWHGMGHGRRIAAWSVMIAVALALGTAWRISAQVTVIATIAIIAAAAAGLAARGLSKSIGERDRPAPPRRNRKRR